MIASNLMTSPVIAVDPGTSIVQAIRLMTQNKVSGLPVVESGGRLVGMLTEGDLLRRVETGTEGAPHGWIVTLLRPGREAGNYVRTHGRRVEEVMTERVITVTETTTGAELVRLMQHHHVKRLPVLRDGRLVGVVSRADIVRRVGEALTTISDTSDDDTIERSIIDAMDREPWAPRNSVCVAVKDGVVQIDGCLVDMRERDAVGVLAENVPGVRRVENRIVCIEPQTGIVTFDPYEKIQGPVAILPVGDPQSAHA